MPLFNNLLRFLLLRFLLSPSTLTSVLSNTHTHYVTPASALLCPTSFCNLGVWNTRHAYLKQRVIYLLQSFKMYTICLSYYGTFFFFLDFWCGTQSLRNATQAPILDTFSPTLLKTPKEKSRAVQMGAAREGQPLWSGRTCQGLLLGYIPDLHSPASCAHQNTI